MSTPLERQLTDFKQWNPPAVWWRVQCNISQLFLNPAHTSNQKFVNEKTWLLPKMPQDVLQPWEKYTNETWKTQILSLILDYLLHQPYLSYQFVSNTISAIGFLCKRRVWRLRKYAIIRLRGSERFCFVFFRGEKKRKLWLQTQHILWLCTLWSVEASVSEEKLACVPLFMMDFFLQDCWR